MIKAIFFDVDGTLLSFKTHKMSQSTRNSLHKLKEKGIQLFICTGRGPAALEHIKVELNFEFDGYIMLNGQYCIIGDEVIHELPIDVSSIETVLPYLEEKNISCEFVEIDNVYMNVVGEKVHELRQLLGNTAPIPSIGESSRIHSNKTYQMCPYISVEEEEEFLKYMPECRSVRWNPLFTDIIPKNGGKAVGVQKMIEHLNLSKDQCMAFGDGGNDIEMLQYVGLGVAMGNANEDVKQVANYVTTDVDQDGIEYALLNNNII